MAGKKKDEMTEAEKLRQECMNDLQTQIEAYESQGEVEIGTFLNVPPEFKGWHFCRYSLAVPHHREIAYMLIRHGWRVAKGRFDGNKEYIPRLMCVGFERGGDHNLYLMCPPEVMIQHERRKADKKRQLSRMRGDDHFGGMLGNIDGQVSVERR